MQITQAADTGLNEGQFPSLRFRFDEHLSDLGGFTRSSTLTVSPIEFGRRTNGPTPDTTHSVKGRITLPVVLEAEKPDGENFSLPEMIFDFYETDAGEIVYRNKAHSEAWEISISSDTQKKHLSMYCHFSYAGLNVKDALNNLMFLGALASGAEFRILKADDRTVLGRARVGEGGFTPDSRWMKILKWLVYIQERARVSINLPRQDITITHDDAATVLSVVKILETGHATCTAEPWVGVSTRDQAMAALETFGGGKPAPMALKFENHVIRLFEANVPLGPVVFFCDETYIIEEDLAELRTAIEAAEPSNEITVRYTPYAGCPIEARYLDWLPPDEAEAIRNLPIHQNEPIAGAEPAKDIPPSDPDAAIALLQSWYDEDPEEQRDTWEKLKAVLGEERLSDRELFP